MAMPVALSKPIVGVDVAKNELVIYQADGDLLEEIPNTKTSIKQWLKALSGTVAIAIEATNIYHLDFACMVGLEGRRRDKARFRLLTQYRPWEISPLLLSPKRR